MSETPEEKVARLLKHQTILDASRNRTEGVRGAAKLAHEFNIIQKFIRQIVAVVIWMWWNFGNPLLNNFTIPFLKKFFSWYVWLWNKIALVPDAVGEPRLSYKRGGGMVVATMVSIWMFGIVGVFTTELIYYGLSNKRDTVYMSFAQEIDPNGNVYSVQGCEIEPSNAVFVCDEDSSLYFRVYPSLFHQAWSLNTRGRVFFPDQVVSSIGANWSKCDIVSYGSRFKLLMYFADFYPILLSARCTPILVAPTTQSF